MMSNLPGMTIETILIWSHSSLVTTRRDLANINATVQRLEQLLQEAEKDKLKFQALAAENQLRLQGQAVMRAQNNVANPFATLEKAQRCHSSYQQAQVTLKKLQQSIQRCSASEVAFWTIP